MDIREEMRAMRARVEASETAHKQLLLERDKLARRAAEQGITWKTMQADLGLSIRGLQIVLGRTK